MKLAYNHESPWNDDLLFETFKKGDGNHFLALQNLFISNKPFIQQ